ncbi:MAG: NAD(P)H-hydrate dehydratase [Actinobacteria bacterium]|nr:NAD(P)H-hydrate dehydratase [Actinomycetota bacterium]
MRTVLDSPEFAACGPVEQWDLAEYAALLPLPSCEMHKYSRGTLLAIGGSARYPGAAILLARGAARCGAGYVTLAVPEPISQLVQGHIVSIPTLACSSANGVFSASAAREIFGSGIRFDACAVGCGITVSEATKKFVETIVRASAVPLLLDADALTLIAGNTSLMRNRSAQRHVTVLTPHTGEMERLLGETSEEVSIGLSSLSERISAAKTAAQAYGAVVVFKGSKTIIADEKKAVISDFGTPALASAGTGDVLSGMIASLLSQGLEPLEAAALGVCIHGMAGRAAARVRSEMCVVAEDVLEHIGEAVLGIMKDGGRHE